MGELLGGEVYRVERMPQPRVAPEAEQAPREAERVHVPVNFAANTKSAQFRLAELLAYMRNLGPGIFVISGAKKEVMSGRIAIHLARDLAATGARVLFLDIDPETSPSSALIAGQRVLGLSDLLAKVAGFSEVIQRDSSSTLHVISHGYGVGDAAQLLSGDRLSIVLGALAQTYEYVVAATPALAGVRGAARLAKFARATAVIAAEGDEEAGERQAVVLKDEQFANVVVISAGLENGGGFSGRFAA
jgi:Mrp family chromosome partitioning ATPase